MYSVKWVLFRPSLNLKVDFPFNRQLIYVEEPLLTFIRTKLFKTKFKSASRENRPSQNNQVTDEMDWEITNTFDQYVPHRSRFKRDKGTESPPTPKPSL